MSERSTGSGEAGGSIVVVEDSRVYRRTLAAFLRAQGHAVQEASDGPRGLELIRRARPDLVVLDLRMPVQDGLDVLRVLAGDPATAAIPVILLSGSKDPVDIASGLAAGARAYFTKPFNAGELRA